MDTSRWPPSPTELLGGLTIALLGKQAAPGSGLGQDVVRHGGSTDSGGIYT
jgi:hypothetical protein